MKWTVHKEHDWLNDRDNYIIKYKDNFYGILADGWFINTPEQEIINVVQLLLNDAYDLAIVDKDTTVV